MNILKDPNRIFLSSPYIRHELCPKALFNKRHPEYRFYREYFQRAVMFNDVRLILDRASREASRSGVSAMDSLHLAAAHLLRADEFITIEHPRPKAGDAFGSPFGLKNPSFQFSFRHERHEKVWGCQRG